MNPRRRAVPWPRKLLGLRLLGGLLGCLLVAPGCADSAAPTASRDVRSQPPVPALIDLLGQPESIKFGKGKPELTVSGFLVSPHLHTAQAFLVPPDCNLAFVPLHTAGRSADGSLTAAAIAGGESHPLGSFSTHSLDRLREEQRWELLNEPEVVDLSSFSGQTIQLSWTFASSSDEAAMTGVLSVPRLVPQRTPSQGPADILLICSDTHRVDYAVGGKHEELMPHLAAATANAVVYPSTYATASWTLPSITSTLTGLPPRFHNTGFRADSRPAGSDLPVPPGYFARPHQDKDVLITTYSRQLETLPETLRGQGYATGMVLSNPLYFTSGLFRDGGDVVARTGVVPGSQVTEYALSVLAGLDPEKPRFLLVHYLDVHQWKPWYFDKEHPGLSRSELTEEGLKASYRQSIRDTDEGIGALLEAWDDTVGLDRSLVVFYSDHGESLLDRNSIVGHGNSMREELLHVPLVVRYPEALASPPAAAHDTRTASLMDIYPTVLEVAGCEPQDFGSAGGHSLLGPALQERLLFADFQLFKDEASAVRLGAHKLTLNFTDNTRELIDTSATPTGSREVAISNAALEQTLAASFARYRDEGRAFAAELISDFQSDAAAAEQDLRQLGYLR
ncbi:MAG: arylsulfatase A-like enzyme [Pseudohongiellaceae bacterium]|jgi:arylsulfatase A-like enzyme